MIGASTLEKAVFMRSVLLNVASLSSLVVQTPFLQEQGLAPTATPPQEKESGSSARLSLTPAIGLVFIITKLRL